MPLTGARPTWLTFDCYGTLIQWDEGLRDAVERILAAKSVSIDFATFLPVFDRHEHTIQQARPHRCFREVVEAAFDLAMTELGVAATPADGTTLTGAIGRMPPFPEVVATLQALKAAGFRTAIISNTDDAIIAGNVAQLGGTIDRIFTAEQAGAYKPSVALFRHAWRELGITSADLVHICASPNLDLTAARDLGFRAVWVDRATGRQRPADYLPDATVPLLSEVVDAFAAAGWMSPGS